MMTMGKPYHGGGKGGCEIRGEMVLGPAKGLSEKELNFHKFIFES